MDVDLIVAVISAAVALLSLAVGARASRRQRASDRELTRLKEELQEQREIRSEQRQKRDEAERLVSKYRDPLLRATFDLQSRLYNIVHPEQRFLQAFPDEESYTRDNTLYVVSQFLAWVEIIRQEVQFLDLGETEQNRKLNELLDGTSQIFRDDGLPSPFLLFTGYQRALGEIMITKPPQGDRVQRLCIGYSEFVGRLRHPDFSRWFDSFRRDIGELARVSVEAHVGEITPHGKYGRLVALQNQLIEILDFLDKDRVRFSGGRDRLEYRTA